MTADLIDRKTALDAIKQTVWLTKDAKEVLQEAIEKLPSADAIEVVRCKDCKHYQFADNRAFGFPVKRCEWTGLEDVDDDDFCSRGERKDD